MSDLSNQASRSDVTVLEYAGAPSQAERAAHRGMRICILIIPTIGIVAEFVDRLCPPAQPVTVLFTVLAVPITALVWMEYDSRIQGMPVSSGLRLLTFLLLPLGFLAYCLRRRRFLTLLLGVLIGLSHAIGYGVVTALVPELH